MILERENCWGLNARSDSLVSVALSASSIKIANVPSKIQIVNAVLVHPASLRAPNGKIRERDRKRLFPFSNLNN